MRRNRYLWLASAALLLAGCSRHGDVPVAAAQGPNPEPAAPVQSAYTQPQPAAAQSAPPQSAPPQDMYPASGGPSAGQPLYAVPPRSSQQATQSADRVAPEGNPALNAYGQPVNGQPAPPPPPAAAAAPGDPSIGPPPPEAASVRTYDGPMVPAGTALHVRLDESLGTKTDRAGERFYASLTTPVVVDGRVLIPAGARFVGHLTQSKPSGHLKGRAVIAVRLDALEFHGRQYPIETASISEVSHGRKRHDLKWIGGGGGLGALIGGIAGGGSGALIGGAAGAGAGTAGALVTPRKQLHMAAETPLTFRLRRGVQL